MEQVSHHYSVSVLTIESVFLKLAESYVECFNLGKIPSVKLNYTSVCEGETQLALQEAIQFYKSSMEEFFLTVDKTPIEQDLLNEVHDELLGTTIELFGQKSKGESSSVNNITFLLLVQICYIHLTVKIF